ncbi:hypothetical protein ANN_21248 [Periplaneta americana]|uniref:Reverse transcriptase domain-containing protein n=1 Tax=Periplaneta americana TaxID=6978 RepID=A0ABQ8SEX4_PERAM|nr:hypothetical protein ANN_21248 [Periplaneta americana]
MYIFYMSYNRELATDWKVQGSIPGGGRIFSRRQTFRTAPRFTQPPIKLSTGSFPGVKGGQRVVPTTPPHSSAEIMESMGLYLHAPQVPSWHVTGIPLPFTILYKDDNFSQFLANAITLLPGPKHPARKYYEARQDKRLLNNHRSYEQSSNPERATKRDREKRRSKYMYQLTQFQYFNQRRKAVHSTLRQNNQRCTINVNKVHNSFSKNFSVPNNCIRPSYEHVSDTDDLTPIETFSTTKEEIVAAANKIAVDTSPGPDHVLMRAIRNVVCYEIISLIATRMLSLFEIPPCLTKARTILIYKGGDVTDLGNWRPINICSILRRIIERVLDKRLRKIVTFHEFQRGFTNSPGTLINTSLLNSILKEAKSRKTNTTLVFLDIRKAFDNIGHLRLRNTLSSLNVPSPLAELIAKLQEVNTTQIELTSEELAEEYGFKLVSGLPNVTVLSFADDMVIVGKDSEAAKHIAEIATRRLHEIGLEINVKKSKCISIVNGKLNTSSIYLDSTTEVPALDINETVKYLGVTYNDETAFDSARTMEALRPQLERLTTSPLLQPYQKYNVVSSFICPKLVYPFQTTPPDKLPVKFLKDVDLLIKSSIKDILQLPGDIPDNMLYSDKKLKGLGIFCARWEAYLQHVNSCMKLNMCNNMYINNTRCLMEEAKHCLNNLQIDETEHLISTSGVINTRKIRTELRQREYNAWCNLPQKGKGVILYSEFTPSNKWITKPDGMTSGEWKEAIKMTTNVSAVRAILGRSQDNHCRRRLSEIETLGHVLGACPYGETLRIHRHHAIRIKLADALRKLKYTVYEEVHGTADNGSNRRIDIIAISESQS